MCLPISVLALLELVQRGGKTGPHKDGWGITFYEGKGSRTFKDPLPSINSPIARLVQDYPIHSHSVVAHIRQANRGKVALENTHPFTRELWGRHWTYAHNGQLKGYRKLETGNFQPVGETDSEKVFCWILYKLANRYPTRPRSWLGVFQFIASLVGEFRTLGVFNMLLSDGCYLMEYCSTDLHWIMRRVPFGKAKLIDQDVEIDFQRQTTPNDIVTVVATQPLTGNETWHKIKPVEWKLFYLGECQNSC